MVKKLKIIGAAVVALLVLIVVLQNTDSVETKVLFLELRMPRAAMLFGAFLVGFAVGVLAAGNLVKKGRKKTDPAP